MFWTDQHNQPLPPNIVKKFDGKVIAIVGYEQDQVMVTPTGQPGVNPDQDVSVPINWAYNHHYMTWMTGEHSGLRQVRVSPDEKSAHATPYKWVNVDTTERSQTPHPDIPTSHFFSEGNGGESRKSYHGYPKGYAQLLQSPQTWHITPMQIDTRNRDCGATPQDVHNCTHDSNGYPAFTPGPEPLQARYGLGIPPQGTNYSGVLECPCNARYGGSALIYPALNASKTKEFIPNYQTQMKNCGSTQGFKAAADCFKAVATIHINNVAANTTVADSTQPLGCFITYDTKTSAATAVYNTGPSKTATKTATKTTTQTTTQTTTTETASWPGLTTPPSCSSDGTLFTGETKSLIGVEVRVEVDRTKGPVSFTPSGKGHYCSNNRLNVIGTPFLMTDSSTQAAQAAQQACQKACDADATCQACSVDCPYELEVGDELSSEICQWSALPSCGKVTAWPGLIDQDVVMKSQGIVTITASGPSDAWFGIGFNAKQMVDQPYTLIVNSTGVIEHKLGTCGSEAEHCPGTLLNKTIHVVSNAVTNGQRTVVMTRPSMGLTGDYYTFAPLATSTIPLITAIGNTQVFAYHKAHMPTTLALVDQTGHTCVCNLGSIEQMCDNNGNECQEFVKDCAPAPAGSLLKEKNPTCSSQTYGGGLQCCHHNRIMLDVDQEIRPELLQYHMKYRWWYQVYDSNVTATGQPSHLNLPRIYQQTEANAGEYDVPPAFAQKDKPIPGYPNWPLDTATPGTTCTGQCGSGSNMKEDCECTHEIQYHWTVGTGQTSFSKDKGGTCCLSTQ